MELASPAEKAARDAAQAKVDEIKTVREGYEVKLKASVESWLARLSAEERARMPSEVQSAALQGAGRSSDQLAAPLTWRTSQDARYQELTSEIDRREKRVPQLPATMAMQADPRETRLFVRGNPERPGVLVRPGVPAFLPPLKAAGTPTRLDLARWLVAPENPLTGRVTVNRIWQQYFGRGIVETADNFGAQTPPPIERDLLDWLATEFVARSWSVKRSTASFCVRPRTDKARARGPKWIRSIRPIAC